MALSPPPPTRRPRAHLAAVQRSTQPPSSSVGTGSISSARMHRKYTENYQEWQDWARRFARTMGIVRFAGSLKADSCARCELRVEERDPQSGAWDATDDQRLAPTLFDSYRNGLEEPPELIRAHAWHYSIAGELMQVIQDSASGQVDWSIYSARAVERKKGRRGEPGMTLVKLTPNGNLRDETAFEVPSDQCIRMWIPDEEWKAYATSPMAASIEPLRRYHSLARVVKRTADSRLVQNGTIWTPEVAHESDGEELEENAPGAGAAQTRSQMQKDFYDIARRTYEDDDDILSVAPYLWWWGQSGDDPKALDVGHNLDEQGIAHRKEALEDFARGIDIPSSIVVGGGPGDQVHWTEWLVDAKYFSSAIAPTMNRITHSDLTATFLRPVLRFFRLPEDRFRVGYDPQPVIVPPDQSDIALRLHMAGLLGDEATLEAANFDIDQLMNPREIAKLLEVLSKGQAGNASPVTVNTRGVETGAPAGPGNVDPTPPQMAPNQPVAITSAAAPAEPAPGVTAANELLARLADLRQRLGRRLLDGAEVAFADAVRRAGVKLNVRANRASAETRAAVRAAVDAQQPLAAHMAAVGVTEAEMLDRSFSSYQSQAAAWIRQSTQQQRAAIRDAGLDPDAFVPDDPGAREAAASFAAASLLAIARQRLAEGPMQPPVGEVSGDVPATVIVRALDVATGHATARPAASPDALPQTTPEGPPLERALVDELAGLDVPIEYTWEWGFYGDPVAPFAPHEDLGTSGFTTTDRENDPALANDESFPDEATYQPQDHPGCTCTWVPSVAETHGVEFGPGTRPVELPNPGTQALEAAGVGAE